MKNIHHFVKEVLLYGVLFFVAVTVASITLYKLSGDTEQYFERYEVAGVRAKLEVFKKHSEQYNTVFIGSSRTYNQVDPAVFDSITGLSSFNMAYSAVQPFRIFDYAATIAEIQPNLDYVFIELSPLPRLYGGFKEAQNLHSVDERRYKVAMEFSSKNDLSTRLYYESMKDYSKLIAYKYIGFNSAKRWRSVLDIYEPSENFVDRKPYLTAGFFPTDSVKNDNAPMRKRQRYFQQHPEALEGYDHAADKVDFNKEPDLFIEEWANINDAFGAQAKVIYVIPPRNPENSITQTAKLKYFLSQKDLTIFDFSDSDSYPSLYAIENSNDEVHLNLKGAKIYTRLLAEKLDAKFRLPNN